MVGDTIARRATSWILSGLEDFINELFGDGGEKRRRLTLGSDPTSFIVV